MCLSLTLIPSFLYVDPLPSVLLYNSPSCHSTLTSCLHSTFFSPFLLPIPYVLCDLFFSLMSGLHSSLSIPFHFSFFLPSIYLSFPSCSLSSPPSPPHAYCPSYTMSSPLPLQLSPSQATLLPHISIHKRKELKDQT